jgi:hypothetical protein
MSQFLDLMTQHYVDLLRAFFVAVDAFNNQDVRNIEGALDDHVVLNKVDNRLDTDMVRGKGDVLRYFGTKLGADKPQLVPVPPISVDSRTGTVSGLARWEDHNGAVKKDVDYSFKFILAPGGQWRIHNMLATPR